MQAVLDEAIEHYQRDRFLGEVNAAFATLRKDPKGWKEEQAERALWIKRSPTDSRTNERVRTESW